MHGQRIGYVRVSSFDQNPERQLEQVPVDKLFTDKASGKDTRRPELERLLAFVREGDTVVVHSKDRLARNLDDLRRLVQGLTQRGVRIEFLKEHLTFRGSAGIHVKPSRNDPKSMIPLGLWWHRSSRGQSSAENPACSHQTG